MMQKLIARIKIEMERYSNSHNDDNAIPSFKPNRSDVEDLLVSYEDMAAALHTANLWMNTLSEALRIDLDDTKFEIKKEGSVVKLLSVQDCLDVNAALLSKFNSTI